MEKLVQLCKACPDNAQALLEALRMLETEGPQYTEYGICTNVANLACRTAGRFVDEWPVLRHLWESWPHWSGCSGYPVPLVAGSVSKSLASYAYDERDKWDWTTEYGKLRWNLVAHCIKTLQEAIEHANQD